MNHNNKSFLKINKNLSFVIPKKVSSRVDLDTALLEHGIIIFNDSVTAKSCSDLIKKLLLLSYKFPKRDIQIYITTLGGNIRDVFSVLDIIHQIPCDVQTFGLSMVYSAGTILIASGTPGKRYSFKTTDFLIHEPSLQFPERAFPLRDLKDRTEELIKARDEVDNFFISYTKLTKNILTKLEKKDSFFKADMAKKYGLIDHIISNSKSNKK